jgi:hypothetical protein
MTLSFVGRESGIKPGPKAPDSPIQAISLLQEFVRISESCLSLTQPHTSTSVIPGYICRGTHFHVPEPIFRSYGGAGGPAHYTRPDSHYSGHDNDRRNDAPPPPAAALL